MAAAHAVCGSSGWPQRTLSAAVPDGRSARCLRQFGMAAAHAVCGSSGWPLRTLSAACPDMCSGACAKGSGSDCGDGLNFDKLLVVAEHGDAEKGARRVVRCERVTNDVPCRHEVFASARSNEHACAYDVMQ